jgi:ABC-type transport system involved in multi-copper enzyme maturation permease subunit
MPEFIENNGQWWVAGAIVLLGLVIYGFWDLKRFSLTRAWAISKVAFSESIRRRVLWITPLAILGVLVVSQLQRPSDEQDAIRQTIKFSLFATGLLVTITTVILACTNLPKEIDTRVIYTVVTKPTTRLEIVVGKVIGFAKVSAAILLIMGLFTFAYLHLRAWSMRRDITDRLAAGTIDPVSRPTYEFWAQQGLLSARTLEVPRDLQVLAHLPKPDDTRRWFYGSGEGDLIVPFHITEEDLTPAGIPGAPLGATGAVIIAHIGFTRSEYKDTSIAQQPELPVGIAAPTSGPDSGGGLREAQIAVQVLDMNLNTLIDPRQINKGQSVTLTDPSGLTPVMIPLAPEVLPNLLRSPSNIVYVSISGVTNGAEYSIETRRDADPLKNPVIIGIPKGLPGGGDRFIAPVPDPDTNGTLPCVPNLRARSGLYGQQLRGGKPEKSPVALFKFRGAPPRATEGSVGFEMRVGIESSGAEIEDDTEPTKLEVTIQNANPGATPQTTFIYPENNRTSYFDIPASALAGGDFDVYVRNHSEGHYVGLQRIALSMVSSQESFDVNLFKSLSILWLLSILVVIISIFCSTFLSWPIAIVLTVVLLLGHWLVVQLGDTLAPGIGNQVATDIFGASNASASQAKVVSASVEALSKLLNQIAKVLPDIGQFSAVEDIEKGATISLQRLAEPTKVLLAFGLPMIVLSYIFLRNKEVAP